MAPRVHRVRRQSWRLGVRSAREAFDARLRLRSALEDELPQTLQRAFDRAAPGDAPVHIPRLELRLRVPNLGALAERSPRRSTKRSGAKFDFNPRTGKWKRRWIPSRCCWRTSIPALSPGMPRKAIPPSPPPRCAPPCLKT